MRAIGGAFRGVLFGGFGAAAAYGTVQLVDSQSDVHRHVVPKVLHKFDPETAHTIAVGLLSLGIGPRDTSKLDPILSQELFGQKFDNPVGLAAGFDKNGSAVTALSRCGFGFVEIGSVTPQPQPGNPKPRIFRLEEDQAVINRCGFNSDGMEQVHSRLEKTPHPPCILGINLGKNKLQEDAKADYTAGVAKLGKFADYMVINVSSPNTPGLRQLQSRDALSSLLSAVITARNELPKPVPVLVKIAPDLSREDLADVAAVVLDLKIDGVIVSNTTLARPGVLYSNLKHETGGLSGRPLMPLSTDMLREMYLLTNGTVPLIGVGGIFTAHDAYQKIRNGASLVQVYSGMVYNGIGIVPEIKNELATLLRNDGFSSISEAVGVDVRAK